MVQTSMEQYTRMLETTDESSSMADIANREHSLSKQQNHDQTF